jgi:hypothetical protein
MFSRLCAILSYPPTLAHEATHYLFARLGSDDVRLNVDLADPESQECIWRPIDSRALRFLAFLGPTLVGTIIFCVSLSRGYVVSSPVDLLPIIILAVYTSPSAADVRGALGKQESQKQYYG